MQLSTVLVALALIASSVFHADSAEQQENKEVSNTVEARGDGNNCLCKDARLELGLKLQQPKDGTENQCRCQKAEVIGGKWSAAATGRKRSRSQRIQSVRYCLKPGKAVWRGERRFYCVRTRHQLKKCKPCTPITFIPTPL